MHPFFLVHSYLVIWKFRNSGLLWIMFLSIFPCNTKLIISFLIFFLGGGGGGGGCFFFFFFFLWGGGGGGERCLINSVFHTIPGPVPYEYEVNSIKCLYFLIIISWTSILLTFSVNTLCDSLLNCFLLLSTHCVKSVRIRSYSGPLFPAFGLNTERYGDLSVFTPNARKCSPE